MPKFWVNVCTDKLWCVPRAPLTQRAQNPSLKIFAFILEMHESKATLSSHCRVHHVDVVWLFQEKEKEEVLPACSCLPRWHHAPQGTSWSISFPTWGGFNPFFTSLWKAPNCYDVWYYATPSVPVSIFYMDYVYSHWANSRGKNVSLTV